MKKLHYFKANSRIGLKNRPIGQAEFNIGVEDASSSILSREYLSQDPEAAVSEFTFSKPENIQEADFNKTLAGEFHNFAQQINSELKDGETQVVLGGDHSVTFGAINALLQRVQPEDVGYIQIDSHPDMNLYSESPTKNFHGLYLRALLDKFDLPEIEAQAPRKLKPENMWFVGNLVFDKGEEQFFMANHIKYTRRETITQNQEKFLAEIGNFARQFKHLHISFDVDGLDGSIAPATGIPAEYGLFLEQVLPLLNTLFEHPSISFDLVEINPRKPGAEATIKLAQNILQLLKGQKLETNASLDYTEPVVIA